jgi:hydroxymethylglutaryl-CoA lyase
VALVDALSATGITSIQVTSFAHPKAVPQMADAAEVMLGIARRPGVEFAVLIPNAKGAERAAKVRADEWSIMFSASESHNRVNAKATLEDAFARMAEIAELGRAQGVRLRGGMSMGLGCPFEGRIPLERLVRIVEAYRALGVKEIGMADTAGVADPRHVYETSGEMIARFPDVTFKLHLHNTRGLGLANALAGMAAGIRIFDSSIGGLGGCPFVPGATGNIATEDLVHMCDRMGIETGVDLDALLEITRGLPDLVGHGIPGSVAFAGRADKRVDLALAKVASA